jgi:hypothetical protein
MEPPTSITDRSLIIVAELINYHAIPMDSMRDVQWKFWQAARKGLDYPINPKFVPWGFFRYKRKDHTHVPLAIWEENGAKWYRFGIAEPVKMGSAADEEAFAYNTFQWVAKHPITQAEWKFWIENQRWPDDPVQDVVAASKTAKAPVAKDPPKAAPKPAEKPAETPKPGPAQEAPGHNSAGMDTLSAEDAALRVRVVIEEASKIKEIKTQAEADASKTLSDRLNELAREADERRDALKRPHWDAGKAVDAEWTPVVIRPAKDEAGRLGRLRGAFALAEKRRMADEAAALAAEGQEVKADAGPITVTSASGSKRKIREIRKAKIVDYDALVEAVKNYQSVKPFMQEIADKVYYAGGELPGCELDIEMRG